MQTGDTSIAGGLVALNSVGGEITSSQASGNVTVGTGSVAGSLVGANNGTISTNSTASGTVTGTGSGTGTGTGTGTGNNTIGGIPSNPPSLSPSTLLLPFSPELREQLAAQQAQQILNLTSTLRLAALSTAPVVNTTQGGIRVPPQQQPLGPTGSQQGQQQLPVGFDRQVIDIPPPSETRFVKDEVVFQIAGDVAVERLEARSAVSG